MMSTVKLNYALQYIDDDLLAEFFQTEDRVRTERTAVWRRTIRKFAAVACIVLLAVFVGVRLYNRKPGMPEETSGAYEAGIELVADPIFLNHEKYQMFADSAFVREILTRNGFPADYSADTIGEHLGYLEMAANQLDGRLCFTSAEEKTNYLLYAYVNSDNDDFFILQSEDHYYLLMKDSIANVSQK